MSYFIKGMKMQLGGLKKVIFDYFVYTGITIHLVFFTLYFFAPNLLGQVYHKSQQWIADRGYVISLPASTTSQVVDADIDIDAAFGKWVPLPGQKELYEVARIGNIDFSSLKKAASVLKDGETLEIGEGVYKEPLILTQSNVTIKGIGHVVIDGVAAMGKAAIINKGNNNRIENIECRNIRVKDRNGACIRHAGKNLTVSHVYFHDSESGILTHRNAGITIVENSRFESLGRSGSAHGIYAAGDQLIILKSLFLAAQDQGHEIKSRTKKTYIKDSVVASLSGKDSRLVDISNGGELLIENSILQQGRASANQDAIGYGLEGLKHAENSIRLKDNLILLERKNSNVLVHTRGDKVEPIFDNNIVVSEEAVQMDGFNIRFLNREEAGLPEYPKLPLSRIDL
ncbi:MAG: hypothetical protein ABW072_16505 [Sedimenticola sp.]